MSPPAGDRLFVYGTLLFPEVLVTLLDRVPARVPAAAPGWRVAALPGRRYPGLVAGDGVARGVLLAGLGEGEWRTLVAYEGDRYDLRVLELSEGGGALAFIWTGGPVCEADWDPEEFEREHLPRYLEGCVAWRRRHTAVAAGREYRR
jgi:hypothetical protein